MSPDYVFDRMQMYEIKPLIEKSYLRSKENWEQSRMIAYIMAQTNSAKKLKPTEIIKFAWDKADDRPIGEPVTNADAERLRQKAELYSKYL